MIDRFRKGRWYRFNGKAKYPAISYNDISKMDEYGGMDFIMDGKWHKCRRVGIIPCFASFYVDSEPDNVTIYEWGDCYRMKEKGLLYMFDEMSSGEETIRKLKDLKENNGMKKIAILYGDNDFQSTILGVINTLGEALKMTWNDNNKEANKKWDDKDFLLDLINNMLYNHYLLWQVDGDRYKNTRKPQLSLEKKRLLLDDEVDEWKNTYDMNNCNHSYVFLEYDSYNNEYYSYIL